MPRARTPLAEGKTDLADVPELQFIHGTPQLVQIALDRGQRSLYAMAGRSLPEAPGLGAARCVKVMNGKACPHRLTVPSCREQPSLRHLRIGHRPYKAFVEVERQNGDQCAGVGIADGDKRLLVARAPEKKMPAVVSRLASIAIGAGHSIATHAKTGHLADVHAPSTEGAAPLTPGRRATRRVRSGRLGA